MESATRLDKDVLEAMNRTLLEHEEAQKMFDRVARQVGGPLCRRFTARVEMNMTMTLADPNAHQLDLAGHVDGTATLERSPFSWQFVAMEGVYKSGQAAG